MTKNISIKFLLLATLCLVCAIGQALAQAGTGGINGTVSDSTGAVVTGATVTLTSKATNQTQTVTTGSDGLYQFVLLQPGTYTVKTTAATFGEQTLDVEVQVGRTTDANFTLGAGGVSAVVEVTADGVQTTTSNFDAVQNETAINTLPINGRRFQDFVTLTPSAQVDPSRGQISLSGQRGINTNVNVDGTDYNQPFFGGIRGGERSNSAFTIPQESIKEFQVVASGYSAEYGRSSGGIVNAVTKSGTNEIHGTLFYLLRPKNLARPNSFAKALADQRLNALGLDATLAPTQHQFGGSIGGPIKKDRLFYFASYEQQKFNAPRQVLYSIIDVLNPATLTVRQTEGYNFYRAQEVQFIQRNDAYALLGKIDWNVNDSNRFNVRYNYSRNKAPNAVATGETALDPTTNNSLSTNGIEENSNHILVGQMISNISSNLVNDARFQYAKENRPRTPNAIVANINTAAGIYGTRNFLPTTQFDRRVQFVDSMTWIKGAHTVKFGGEYSDIFADQLFGFNQTGVYNFIGVTGATAILDNISATRDTTTTPAAPYYGRFDNTGARYTQQIGNLQAAFGVKELAVFAQDTWQAWPRHLTLNFGLRFEKQYNPASENNNTTILNLIKNTPFPILGGKGMDTSSIPDSQNEWGPRVGLAYDPRGDGRTVIRAFAGQYFARTPLIVLAAPFNNFRDPAGDLSVQLGNALPAGFSLSTFAGANPAYLGVLGLTSAQCTATPSACSPNTLYRQFAILGINLNSTPLTGLPTLTPQQMATITNAINAATTPTPTNLGIYQLANFVGINPDFRNPQSFQFGGGIEHQIRDGLTVALDLSVVNTVYLQRNKDINLPAPGAADPLTGRITVNRALRPLTNLGTIQIRDSSGHSLYRAMNVRINWARKWGRVNAFYTLSKSTSDDDNERDAGGVLFDNPYDFRSEYGRSRLDRRHQFVANPIFFLPWGFEVSSAIRFRSGSPIESKVGTDLNADGNNNERPFTTFGIELPRNAFSNRPLYDIDVRVQKGISFGEKRRILFSAEFFNVLNRSNLQFSGTATTNYCAVSNARCGLDGITNINFMNLIQQTPTATNFGKLNIAGLNPGSQVFQMQLGARFQF